MHDSKSPERRCSSINNMAVKPISLRRVFQIPAILLLAAGFLWNTRLVQKSFIHDHYDLHIDHVQKETWSWDDIVADEDITWHPCYEKFDCAKLDVPLDWLDPTPDLRASIALIRYNATDISKGYGGPVFINPGGPGGSGVYFVSQLAEHYQTVVGRNHDIISFDPRGIGLTTPLMKCWQDQRESSLWTMQELGVVDSHEGVLWDAYARATAYSRQCAKTMGGGVEAGSNARSDSQRKVLEAGPGRFVSTASVARDLLQIMEKVGQEKLKYWGFSYGTVLGTTFAAMYPDRIERMVNDGNVDTRSWYAGNGVRYIEDADKIVAAFYHFCHLSGPDVCSFYASSPEAIETRLDNLLLSVKKRPVVVDVGASFSRPYIISFSDVRRMINTALYRPIQIFPKLADALTALEQGDGLPLFELRGIDTNVLQCDVPDQKQGEELVGVTEDATAAIMCSETEAVSDSVDDFQTYVDKLVALSKSAGATTSSMRLACVQWGIKAKWRFQGPYNKTTSFPLLFIANKYDNVTPLSSARKNSQNFPGSSLLIQNAYGHTSLSTPSRCTSKAIRAYFQSGTLPKSGTTCEGDTTPFGKLQGVSTFDNDDNGNNDDNDAHEGNDDDSSLEYAMRELSFAPVIAGMKM